jgi:PAS domain S-box-containing protein
LFHSNVYDTSLVMIYQMFFIALTFSLFLMVNRRLVANLEFDLVERRQAEAALKLSEEKFFKAFHSSPDAILITRISDGKLVEVNEGFSRITEYSRDEAFSSSSINLKLWANPQERDIFLANLQKRHSIHDAEYDFRAKSGRILHCLLSGETILLNDEAHVFTIVRDITERKRAEESMLRLTAIEERQRLARDLHDSVNQSIHSLVLFSETLVAVLEKNNVIRAKQIAERLQESARQALKETRLMLYELQSSDTERDVNFIQDLETRLSTVERRAGVKVQVIHEGSMEYCPRKWYENLFWITIEALNNALKHAQARNMQVIINCFPQYVNLEVADDGIGFDPALVRSGGLGLRNIRERTELLGGELTIDSSPGKGSRVRFHAEIK